ncbi:MAG: carbohydrate kinase family protein [Pirellula sp.]|jgi:fructokinase
MTRKIVVGLGEVLWDVYPDQALFGGAPANFACHAASLGADARIASAVGQDALGSRAIDWLLQHDLSCDWIAVDPKHPTGCVDISLDAKGMPEYRFAHDVAWDFLELKAHWQQLAQTCDAVCYGTLAQRSQISSQTILEFLDRTSPQTLRVFDVNLRQQFYGAQVLSASIQRANIVKLNHEELPIVTALLGMDHAAELQMCDQLIQRYSLKALALTRGAQGSAVYLDGQWDQRSAPKIQAIDTVGAGDAFSAALIMGVLQGKPLEQIHARAASIAAYVCTQRGAVVPIPKSLVD